MRSHTAFPLDDDVVDYVLSSLPDYTTLSSFRLTCKAVNSVFKRHPQSIQCAIAKNLTGDNYCQALRVVRAVSQTSMDGIEGDENSTRHAMNFNSTWREVMQNRELSGVEMHAIEKNAWGVRGLEDLFSWR
jgi:hypothetical protein